MKKVTIIILLFIFSIIFKVPISGAIEIPKDEGISYILIDSASGRVLAEQDADKKLYPASVTKIMTAIVALENGDLSREVTVSAAAVNDIGKGGMNIGIMAGEKGLTLENMLNVLLIKSANESANIIAENVAKSRAEFVDMMNKKAAELGAVNTNFVNPSGKDTEKEDVDHLSTARDISLIARYAMTIPKFREIVSKEYYKDMPVTDKHDDWGTLRSSNQFLWYDNTYPYMLNGTEHKFTVNGIKTGYTALAGNNLVTGAVGEDGMELISVVLHVTQPNKIYGYSKELLKYGFENFAKKTISKAGTSAAEVAIKNADDGSTTLELVTQKDFSCACPVNVDENITNKLDIPESLEAPITKGQIIGEIEYISGSGESLGKVNLIAARSISAMQEAEATDTATESADDSSYSYTLLGILMTCSGLVILRMILKGISRKRRKKKTNYQ